MGQNHKVAWQFGRRTGKIQTQPSPKEFWRQRESDVVSELYLNEVDAAGAEAGRS